MQSYLDRMTPEQQQQYLQTQQGILSRIQRKQELNSQIQAQVDAHKQKQQQNLQSLPGSSLPSSSLPGSSLPGSSLPGSSLPATLQKISVVPQKAIVPGKVNIFCLSVTYHINSGLQIRVRTGKLTFLFLNQNICCRYSKEPSQ